MGGCSSYAKKDFLLVGALVENTYPEMCPILLGDLMLIDHQVRDSRDGAFRGIKRQFCRQVSARALRAAQPQGCLQNSDRAVAEFSWHDHQLL